MRSDGLCQTTNQPMAALRHKQEHNGFDFSISEFGQERNKRLRNAVSTLFELDVLDHLFGKPLDTSIKRQVQRLTVILYPVFQL